MSVYSILQQLENTSGRNDKIAILEQNKNNSELRRAVQLAIDPFTQFYIRKIPPYLSPADPCAKGEITLTEAMDRLYHLSSRILTGNDGIAWLKSILEKCSYEDAQVIERIIQKDLDCGVQVSTANKVWSGLVLDYPIMLCSPYNEKTVSKIKYPAYVQLKMDGGRFNAIVRNGKVEFRTRNGRGLDFLGEMEEDFLAAAGDIDCVFDGELVVVDKTGNIVDRKTGNGILNKANKGTISKDEASCVRAVCWDLILYAYFEEGYDPTPYTKRLDRLTTMLNNPGNKKVSVVKTDVVNNLDSAMSICEGYYSQGEEGVIIKNMNSVWENKRSKDFVKVKNESECDLVILDIVEGDGKYKGKLGAIVCSSADGALVTYVGSGFTDAERDQLYDRSIIGKVAAVKYNMVIDNKNSDTKSLFLPIFVEVRGDKTVADKLEDLS